MVAPKAETIFTSRMEKPIGINLWCPECTTPFGARLRVETALDHPPGKCPPLAGNSGPLGFIARCDRCGFRVELHGDRLATVQMMERENTDGD